MYRIVLLKRLNQGLVLIDFKGDVALWSAAAARKPATCAMSGRPIAPRDRTFRPIGNQSYRMQRIRADVLDEARISVIHMTPPEGSDRLSCCGRSIFAVSRTDRVTLDPEEVTCSTEN